MVLDFSKEGKLVLDMCDYVKGMVKDWEAVAESLAMSSSLWTEKCSRACSYAHVPDKMYNATQDNVTTLEADDTQSMQWHIDAAFAVHGDYKSHMGATLTLGKGTVTSISCKQKINTRSSTESELVGIDD
eukprot:scaffold54368_cov48-Attheya_sp.AAC.1